MDDNTEQEQQAPWANIPYISLHVDLMETDLEDFIEHFGNRLRMVLNQVHLLGAYFDDPLLGDVQGYTLLWNDEPEDDKSPTLYTSWEDLEPGKYLRITLTRSGATRASYLVDAWVEDPTQPKSGTSVRFHLVATRFRRDRLKIVVLEERYTPIQYAPHLKDWLLGGWGKDGVIDLRLKDAPPMPGLPELMPLLPNRAKPEQWYAWFDWYYRQPWGSGELSARLRHMAQLNGKSHAQVAAMHSLYRDSKRQP